jgi:Transmembrane protein 65
MSLCRISNCIKRSRCAAFQKRFIELEREGIDTGSHHHRLQQSFRLKSATPFEDVAGRAGPARLDISLEQKATKPTAPATAAGVAAAAPTATATTTTGTVSSTSPSFQDLQSLFIASSIPMIGFGFMDNVVMIHAGQYIDSTLGVTLGLATLTAAAAGTCALCGGPRLLFLTLVCNQDKLSLMCPESSSGDL